MSFKRKKSLDSETEPLESSQTKLLSCQRCRARKVKCNFQHPCSSCIKAETECIRTINDMRKKRPPVNYVTSLEKKIRRITGFLNKFKNAETVQDKSDLLAKINLEELLSKDLEDLEEPNKDSEDSRRYHQDPRHKDSEDSEDRAVYGPTSVYDGNLITKNAKLSNRVQEAFINQLNKDEDILHCIKLFFTWQYPDHNMFIFREAFLIDFFDPKPNSLYCSKILILSICALGSKMSDDDRIYKRSIQFYQEAKTLLLNQLSSSSITSLQSFLLLAFFDICNGYNSSGWMLSGNAMRMGFDLGFQLNPQVWFVKSKEDLNPLDVSIRSRIYWGSYVADHFISLLLGRPSLLKMSDATIPETGDLPDLESIDEYTYVGFAKSQNKIAGHDLKSLKEQSYISNPLKNIINLINISDNILDDIFTKSDVENEQSNHEDLDLISRLEKSYEYNAQIMDWKKNLPQDLRWDKASLKNTAENPTLSCIRYYYYVLILCLNRPFVGIDTKIQAKNHDPSLSPLNICLNAIEDLYEAVHKFQSVHGFRRVSIFMVYCSILSISVILLTNTSKQLIDEKRDRLQFFMDVLKGSSKTWKLAEKSYNLINIKLKTYEDPNFDELVSVGDIPVKSEDNHSNISGNLYQPITTNLRNENFDNFDSIYTSHNLPRDIDINVPIVGANNHLKQIPNSSDTDNSNNNYTNVHTNHTQSNDGNIPLSTSAQHTSSQSTSTQPTSTHSSNHLSSEFHISHIPSHPHNPAHIANPTASFNKSIVESNTELLFDKNLDFLGGPPVLMTSDLFNEDWEALFPDYMFNPKN